MENGFINFEYKARYFTWGSPGSQIRHVWFVCHGYGQLAKYFLKKFECLKDEKYLIIAPEGLSKFYLEGFSGRVGATWMTKEARETDIRNYLSYLNALGTSVRQQLASPVTTTLLGFSQGAATAARWVANTSIPFDRFILWAGIFPSDLNIKDAYQKLKPTKNYLVYGDNDPFLTPARIQEQNIICNQLGIHPSVVHFSGGHDIHTETLKRFIE